MKDTRWSLNMGEKDQNINLKCYIIIEKLKIKKL